MALSSRGGTGVTVPSLSDPSPQLMAALKELTTGAQLQMGTTGCGADTVKGNVEVQATARPR
jgi:hypothetical protein